MIEIITTEGYGFGGIDISIDVAGAPLPNPTTIGNVPMYFQRKEQTLQSILPRTNRMLESI